jgi:hypothetical protein
MRFSCFLFVEGEAPAVLLPEGVTRAPVIA